MRSSGQKLIVASALAGLMTICSCTSTSSMLRDQHGGIRYTIHPDKRFHRIEKGSNGRLIYDSPELVVTVEHHQININGKNVGPVKQGDHIEITDLGTVLVNGEHRGDVMTNYRENERRLQARKKYVDGVMQASAEEPAVEHTRRSR